MSSRGFVATAFPVFHRRLSKMFLDVFAEEADMRI